MRTIEAEKNKIVNETYYDGRTADKIIEVLEEARANGTRITLEYGDTATGKGWGDIYDVTGTVGRSMGPNKIPHNEIDGPFEIELLEEGSLMISNLHIAIKGKNFLFKTTYNSKANYPLYLEYDSCDYLVFDERGNWDSEFIKFCESVIPFLPTKLALSRKALKEQNRIRKFGYGV